MLILEAKSILNSVERAEMKEILANGILDCFSVKKT